MSENQIIGFANPNHFFPMCVVIVYVNDNKVFGRWPSGQSFQVDITEEEFCRSSLMPVKEKSILSDGDIAFAISEEEVYVEPVEKTLERIQALLDSGRFEDNADAKEILKQLLSAK